MNWCGAFWLALPGVFLFGRKFVGQLALLSLAASPLSGDVKFFLQKQNGWWLHGSPWAELIWHLRFVCDIAMWPLGRSWKLRFG